MRNFRRNVLGFVLTLSILSLMFTLSTHDVKAQSSGRYPDTDTFNGMVITYSVSGADLTAPVDYYGFTTSRAFNGTITGSTVTISGTLHQQNGYGADATVSVTVGNAVNSSHYSGTTPWDQSFSVSVNVPPGAQAGSFSIDMEGSYNAGGRGLVVSGQFLAPPSTVDHVAVVSPYDNVMAGDSPFSVNATVYASGNSQVPDGTQVTFSLTDKERGTLAGASILPQTAGTLNSAVTATFTPPSAAYWDDPLHANYAGQNSITITASAGGKQGAREILIYRTTTVSATTDSGGTVDLPISGSITSSQMSNIQITTNQNAKSTTLFFTVTGQSGTTGFSNVTIPKSAVPYGTTPTINIDNQPAQDQGYTQEANIYYFVWYTTQFSTHEVSIVFTSPGDTGTPWIIIGVIAAIAVVVVVVVTVLLVHRRKPAAQTMPSRFPPPPPPP